MNEFENYSRQDVESVTLPPTFHPLSTSLMDNLVELRKQFGVSSDLVVRHLTVGGKDAAIVSVEGMVDKHILATAVTLPILAVPSDYEPYALMDHIRDNVLGFTDILQVMTVEELLELIMSGFVAILINGCDKSVLGGLQAFAMRGVSEPSSEMTMRGSRESFTEAIRVNISMVRRRLKTPELTFEMMSAGKTSHTAVCLCYMKNRVSQQLLTDVRSRIQSVPLDVILESGYLEPFLENRRRSLFTSVNTTERPDTLCGKIVEGRIGVLVDGTPFVLVTPTLFVEHFQSMDDYAMHPFYASFLRIIKYAAFFVSVLLPGLYVSLGTYHPEMFPSVFLLSFLKSDQSTPFPLMVEALMIHFLFEVMREAGLRFPKAVGHAVSIVGALVIGDSAVNAGLIGAPMVIIVGLTAICSFVLPSLYGPMTLLRFGYIFLGGVLGLYGITIGVCLLLFSICSMNVHTIPITAPVTPFTANAMSDVFYRPDWRDLWKHPFLIQNLRGSRIQHTSKEEEDRP